MPLFVISNSYLILLEKEKAHAWKKFKTKSQGQPFVNPLMHFCRVELIEFMESQVLNLVEFQD